jgi:hypothetical protein
VTLQLQSLKDRLVKKWPSSPLKSINPRRLSAVILLEGDWIKAGCPGITKFSSEEVANFLYELREDKPITSRMSSLWTGVHIHWYKYIKRYGRDEFQLICYLTESPKTVHQLWSSTEWSYKQLNKRIKSLHDKLKERGLGHLVIVDVSRKEFRYSLNPSLFK